MKTFLMLTVLGFTAAVAAEPNPKIDYSGFVREASRLENVREQNRLSEEEFLKQAQQPGTVILDARTREHYEAIHVRGAVHLPLTEFTAESLKKLIPDPNTRILIYCNNNFDKEPTHFAAKAVVVALNIQTFMNLHSYGYRNVGELGPFLDRTTTKIPFEGTSVKEK